MKIHIAFAVFVMAVLPVYGFSDSTSFVAGIIPESDPEEQAQFYLMQDVLSLSPGEPVILTLTHLNRGREDAFYVFAYQVPALGQKGVILGFKDPFLTSENITYRGMRFMDLANTEMLTLLDLLETTYKKAREELTNNSIATRHSMTLAWGNLRFLFTRHLLGMNNICLQWHNSQATVSLLEIRQIRDGIKAASSQ